MSTRTRRKELGETKTQAQRRKERWQAKLAAATTPAERFAVRQDWFRSSVELMIRRHTRTEAWGKVTDSRAEAQGDQLLDYAGGLLDPIITALDGGDYDQPGQ